uniref:Uncharacterized protein n=1 Tax=Rhizophora mucronata TaxID=61149 RepID=A0A2P2PAC5_RHIMU
MVYDIKAKSIKDFILFLLL